MADDDIQCFDISKSQDGFFIQERYDNALFQSVFVSFTIFVVLSCLFTVIRNIFKPVYMKFPIIKPKEGYFEWIKPIFLYSDEELYKSHGLDVLMFTLLQKSVFKCLIVFFTFGLLVLLPVDATGSNRNLEYGNYKRTTGLAIFSISNIDSENDKGRLTVHVLSVLINSITVYIVFYRLYKKYVEYKLRSQNEMRTGNFTLMIHNVNPSYSDKEIYKVLNKLFPKQILSIHRTYRSTQLYKNQEKRNDFIKEFEYSIFEATKKQKRPLVSKGEGHPIVKRIFPCCRKKVDAIDYFKSKIDKYTSLIEEKVKNLKLSDTIFVTFNNKLARMECSGLQIVKDGKMWSIELTNNPNDIIWSNFSVSPLSRKIRYIIIFIVTIFIGIFFSVPVTLAQGFANLGSLARIKPFTFLQGFTENMPVLANLISGLLPPLVVTLFFILVEIIIEFLVWIESPLTNSRGFQRFLTKFHFVQLLNVFLISLIAGSLISRIDILFECLFKTSPQVLIELVGRAISGQVNFFMNYFAMAVISLTVLSMQPFPLFKYIFINYICCCFPSLKNRTKRDFHIAKNIARFKFGLKTSQCILNLIITITFSSISAVIVPFAMIELFVNFFTSRYALLYLHQKDFEAYGSLWPKSFSLIFTGISIYQIIMTGVFLVKSFTAGVVISLILVIFTIIFAILTNRSLYRKTKRGTADSDNFKLLSEKVLTQKLRESFKDPNLTPKIDRFFKEALETSLNNMYNEFNDVELDNIE